MMEIMDYDERIREAQEDGDPKVIELRRATARTAVNSLMVGEAFYRELVPSRGAPTLEDVLEQASPDAPLVLWETRGKTAHMLVVGSKLDVVPHVEEGDVLSAVGRRLATGALRYPTGWHVCWIDEDARGLRIWEEGDRPPQRVSGMYLEELGQDFPGEIAWDTNSAIELLRALTRASSEDAEKPPGELVGQWFLEGRKNTLVVVERPRSHEVLGGVEELIRTARSEELVSLRNFGAGVHVVVLTESPGSLPLSFMKRFGQRLALPTTKAASRDVLGGSEAAGTFPGTMLRARFYESTKMRDGLSTGPLPGGASLSIPAVFYDEERGERDVLVPYMTEADFRAYVKWAREALAVLGERREGATG